MIPSRWEARLGFAAVTNKVLHGRYLLTLLDSKGTFRQGKAPKAPKAPKVVL